MTVAGCAFALLATSCSEAPVSTNEVKSSGISAKSSTLAQKSAKVHLKFKGSNFGSEIDSAIGTLTTIYLKRDGNVPAKDKDVLIWDQFEYFNLTNMNTGIMGDIAFLVIPEGSYSEAIVNVTGAWVYKNGIKYDCKVPSGIMKLKFSPSVIVGEHMSTDLTIDLDVSNSFVKAGGSYIFKPIVNVANNSTAGSMAGAVIDTEGNLIPDAYINISGNGIDETTMSLNQYFTDDWGFEHFPGEYGFQGIPGGTYTATAYKEGYEPQSQEVTIVVGNFIFRNFVLTAQ